MTTEELEAVFLLNLYRSYSRASEISGIGVSTLSQRLSSLEKELGAEIFFRTTAKNSLQLTEFGRELFPHIQRILGINSDIRYQSEVLGNERRESIRIGLPAMPCYERLGHVMLEQAFLNPECELVTVVRTADELVRYMINGDIDCCFLISDIVGGNLSDVKPLFAGTNYDIRLLEKTEKMWVCLSEKDALAAKKEVSMPDLQDRRFIFNMWSINHMLWSRERKLPFFNSFGLDEERFSFCFEDYTNESYLMGLVAGGYGVVPLAFCSGSPFQGTVWRRIREWKGSSYLFFISRRSAGEQLSEFRTRVLENWDQQ